MYQKINTQAESLQGLWRAKLNLRGRKANLTKEDIAAYENRLKELNLELERRKRVGSRFEAVLLKIKDIMDQDEMSREEHQVGL